MKRLSLMARLSHHMAEPEDEEDEDEKSSPLETATVNGMKIILNDGAIKVGSFLRGRVVIAQCSTQVSSLTVTLTGLAMTQFAADDGKVYKAKYEFLSEKIDLSEDLQNATASNAKEEISMPYQCRMPDNIPPSFLGNYGSISYECKAILKFSSALVRRRIRKATFRVIPKRSNESAPSSPTTNKHPSIDRSGANSAVYTHRLTSLGFLEGEVDVRLQTNETSLKRGKTTINVVLDLTNRTNLHLRDLRFGILLTTEWNAKGRRLTERKLIFEENREDFCLQPAQTVTLQKEFGPIAIDQPPTVEFFNGNEQNACSPLCRCSYTVFAKLVPPNFAKSCLVEIPLCVY